MKSLFLNQCYQKLTASHEACRPSQEADRYICMGNYRGALHPCLTLLSIYIYTLRQHKLFHRRRFYTLEEKGGSYVYPCNEPLAKPLPINENHEGYKTTGLNDQYLWKPRVIQLFIIQ